jgi:GNAT superfamily N-acetyltransferase
MLECKVFKDEEAPQGASVAIMNELHMPHHCGWELKPRLASVINKTTKAYVAIAYKDGEPVSVVLVRLTRDGKSGYDIAAYCKEQHRRQGITSQLIKTLKDHAAPIPKARTGITGSHHFWNNNGIDCPAIYW